MKNWKNQTMKKEIDIIPDETYQMDEPDHNNSDERDQIRKIIKKKIIEDEETVQLKILGTAIEKTNRKEKIMKNQTNQTLKK